MDKDFVDKSTMHRGKEPEHTGPEALKPRSESPVIGPSRRRRRPEIEPRPAGEKELLGRLRRNDINLDTLESRMEFINRYRPLLEPPYRRRPNILHHIAELEDFELDATKLVLVVRLLLQEFPRLANVQNPIGKTALHVALDSKNTHFVQAATDVLKEAGDILAIQDRDGRNCIHLAIEAGISNTLILGLIHKAPETAFKAQEKSLGLTPLHLAVEYERCVTEQLEVVEALLRKDHGALRVLSQRGLSPYRYHLRTARDADWVSSSEESDWSNIAENDIKINAAQIRDTMKLWILRTSPEFEAKKLLYGYEHDIQLSFGLNRDPQDEPIPISTLDVVYGSLEFDSVLSLISLGDFRIQEAQQNGNLTGRSDALFIFDWLRCKGISRVIEVMVKDHDFPSHSEETIEKALWGLRVECLDWQIADICPAVVRSVGEALEDLALYWRGNNAVLRGWSEPEGLPRLPNLRHIQLTVMENLHESERLQRNLAMFRARMLALKPGIQIEIKTKVTHQLEALGNTGTEKWLRCIETFGGFLDKVEALTTSKTPPEKYTVRVALLDNGIDYFASSIQGRIHSRNQYFKGDTKHGTHIAALILRVCPQAELHFFKVDLLTSSGEASRDAPLSIVRAFEDAARVVWGSDVMCMPWTIRIAGHDDAASDKMRILDTALINSYGAGTALLCASPPNHQSFLAAPGEAWPAHSREVIEISAVAERGVVRDGPFYFPGDAKITNQGDNADFISPDAVATAMAAGLAATIMRCWYLVGGGEKTQTEDPEEDLAAAQKAPFRPKRASGFIERAFSVIARGAPESGQLMPIWDFFRLPEGMASPTEALDLDDSMAFLSDLVQRLRG